MTDKHSASRARALAAELRDLRRQATLNTREAAKLIGVSPASLNRAELGTRMPGPEEVSALLVVYGVTGVPRERVLELARAANPSGWWEIGGNALPRQLPTLIKFESQASTITHFEPLFAPGLLQTHAYMRAVMEAAGVSDPDAEARVATRAGRQTVLTRKAPPRYTAVIDEAQVPPQRLRDSLRGDRPPGGCAARRYPRLQEPRRRTPRHHACGTARPAGASPIVDVATVPESNDHDEQHIILHRVDDAVLADAYP